MSNKPAPYSQVTPTLWVGGAPMFDPDPLATRELIIEKQAIVIDCRDEEDRDEMYGWSDIVDGETPSYVIPLFDDGERSNTVESFVNLATQIHDDGHKFISPMFVHCHMGINRGPSVAMFMLMLAKKVRAEEAYAAVLKARPYAGLAYATLALHAAGAILSPGRTRYQRREMQHVFQRWEEKQWDTRRRRVHRQAVEWFDAEERAALS